MPSPVRDPNLLPIARAIAAEAVRDTGGDLEAALLLVARTAALFAANVSAGFMRLAPPREPCGPPPDEG